MTESVDDVRWFDMLDNAGKERVVYAKTVFNNLSDMEKSSFLQEMKFRSLEDQAARLTIEQRLATVHGAVGAKVREVQKRDPAFVVMSNSTDRIGAAASLGMTSIDVHPQFTAPDTESNPENFAHRSVAGDLTQFLATVVSNRSEDGGSGPVADAANEDVVFRSKAYSAARLALSAPGHINDQPDFEDGVARKVLNVTGMPYQEEDLRLWFDHLDSAQTGTIDWEEFKALVTALERDMGAENGFASFYKEGDHLAQDNRLDFPSFGYLVQRFARA